MYVNGYSAKAPYDLILCPTRPTSSALRKQLRDVSGICFDFENRVEFNSETGARVDRPLDLNNEMYVKAKEAIFGKAGAVQHLDHLAKVQNKCIDHDST